MSKTIELSQGYVAIVDDEDYEYLSQSNWHARNTPNGVYAVSNRNGTTIQMHRIILNAPKNLMVDHRDRNGLNNTRGNLRLSTRSQNLMNSKKPNKGKTSKYKGVHFLKKAGESAKSWRSEIRLNKRAIYLGVFHTEIEAALAYNAAALKYFGEFAKLNEVT